MPTELLGHKPYVFLSLLTEPAGSRAVEVLRAAVDPTSPTSAVLEAPVRGIEFFTARGSLAAELDAWWQQHVPSGVQPVVLVMHEPGLEQHLAGLDTALVVGVAGEDDRRRYDGLSHVRPVLTDDPLALAEHAIASFDCFSRAPEPPPPAEAADTSMVFVPRERNREPDRVEPEAVDDPLPPLPDPFSALAGLEPTLGGGDLPTRADEMSRATLFDSRRAGTPSGRAWLRPVRRLFGQGPVTIPHEIGDLVLSVHPTPVVVVPGRKGGVGKTVTAGAVAQVVGYALGETTGSAAIVDQNIGNPDQWGRLDIPATTGTVRQLMAALSSGLELPPAPAWAATPALAVYPEDRAAVDAYPPGLIQRFVHHLRERHVFVVVDLPNRLPDFSSAEAAICAAYLDLADLVILPTTDDPTALLGAIEYLDVRSMQGKPVIVSHIESNDRRLSRHPVVTELLEEIRKRVVAVVTVPRSEKATLAIVEGTSILDISSQLREAYIRVTQAAVRALAG